ncbi:hypothetical protein CISG_04580 [Coccidioides immitis RMSCC 3703]|uniref:Uncharacterized protein n=2 Tax=Coccidioides immitis TaxID=5501 RepID=A0A0J8QP32_COCIT|nr:hypothetical protein CIRG_01324 [Coccidioides immitis RMSCC 2394]KMU74231.1 hypothetical protein CISG_04580 [Coccidioides immitis RMSCC 3703]
MMPRVIGRKHGLDKGLCAVRPVASAHLQLGGENEFFRQHLTANYPRIRGSNALITVEGPGVCSSRPSLEACQCRRLARSRWDPNHVPAWPTALAPTVRGDLRARHRYDHLRDEMAIEKRLM